MTPARPPARDGLKTRWRAPGLLATVIKNLTVDGRRSAGRIDRMSTGVNAVSTNKGNPAKRNSNQDQLRAEFEMWLAEEVGEFIQEKVAEVDTEPDCPECGGRLSINCSMVILKGAPYERYEIDYLCADCEATYDVLFVDQPEAGIVPTIGKLVEQIRPID